MLTACQYEAFSDDKQDFYKETGNRAIHVSDKNELYNSRKMSSNSDHDEAGTNFGFVRHQKSPIAGENDYYVGDMPQIDREQVADLISKMSILLPNVNDVGTLVTDEEVLIAYETDSSNRFETADQVKKTAMSVVPRWYHVYVSDDPMMIDEVQKYGRLDSNSRDIDRILDTTIKDMLNAPQGRKLSDGENANGEMINETNEEIDEDMNEGTNTGIDKGPVKTEDKDDRANKNDTDDNGETYRNNRL
ncbi:sporulation protein [Bacillus sp. BGMRC 2118]|nr:sporulation protein [Bacillus sp. BGMRC 2118]